METKPPVQRCSLSSLVLSQGSPKEEHGLFDALPYEARPSVFKTRARIRTRRAESGARGFAERAHSPSWSTLRRC